MGTSRKTSGKLSRVFSVVTSIATIAVVSGLSSLAPVAMAVAPADYGLQDGDFIRATGGIDIYIINSFGYKRLVLSPDICKQYGHLGRNGCFSAVKVVPQSTVDAFQTSHYYTNGETNDGKVYVLITTGGDSANLHQLTMSGADFKAQGGVFNSVFRINNLEKNSYGAGASYSAISQIPGQYTPTTTPVAGAISVSLASSNPSARTITTNAYGVTYLTMRLTGTGTINEITLTRKGPGAVGDFANVYLYDGATRLTSGKTLSSSTGTVTFTNLGLSVSGSKDISVVADLSGTSGNVDYFEVSNIIGTSTVTGFPISGNNFTVSGATSGTITLAKTGSLSNPNVGQANVQVSEFKLTANTEAASIKRITMLQGGTVKASDLTNLKLIVDSTTYSGTMTTSGYAVFDLGSGVSIAKGANKIFKVYADVAGKKSETVIFYFELATDIYGIGDQYGFGMAATITALDTTGEATTLTLQGGVLTLNFVGPTATNIGTDASDVNFLEYSMTAASNIEVKKTALVLCADHSGDGTFDALATAGGMDDLEDIKIMNSATGTIMVGPSDGSSTTWTAESTASCPNSVKGLTKTFTDSFELSAGQTINFKVTADVKTANTADYEIDSADKVAIVLEGYGTLTGTSGDVSAMKYSGTTTAVTSADISPSTDVSGPSMTVQAASLTLGLASSPKSQTYVKGTSGIDAVGITFAASLASALKVTDITLTGYVADSGGTLNKGIGAGVDSNMSVANLVSGVKLYEGETGTLVGSTFSSNSLSNSTGTVTFSNLNWTIPAGSTKTLLVRTDLSTNATSGTSDVFSFDIAATTDVTALDSSSTSINAGNEDVNGTTSPTVIATVNNSGSLSVALDSANTPITAGTYWGQTGVEFSKFRFTSVNEGHYIEKLNLYTADTAANLTNNVGNVYLTYTTKAGTSLTATGVFNTAGSVSFGFTGDNRPYVPKDSSTTVTVKADMKTKAQGATNNVNFSIDFSGGNADEFLAYGDSGTQVEGTATGIVDVTTANNKYVYRVFPKIDLVTDTSYGANSTILNPTDSEVLRFTVSAMGASDARLLFDNVAVGSGSIVFEVLASGTGTANVTFSVYDAADGSLVDSGTITNGTLTNPHASMTFDFSTKDVEISGGGSKTFYVRANLSAFGSTGDLFSLALQDDAAGLINWVASSTGSSEDADTASTAGVLRQLPLYGTTKVKAAN